MLSDVEYPQRNDPHHLRQTKEALITVWDELPPEHQATMLLVLLTDVMQGEYQAWIVDALQRLYLSGKGTNGMG